MKITTLVPAYKTQYLAELLTSLRTQTRRSDRIIVSDDSPNGEFRAALFADSMAAQRAGLAIEFHEGPRRGGYPNIQHLLSIWAQSSELVHVMLDDDVIYPRFYEQHLRAHASGVFSCSISSRWTANEHGQPIGGMPVPQAVAASPQRMLSLSHEVVFMSTVPECKNWFGEFSNAVFTARGSEVLHRPVFEGMSYAGLWDLGAFLAASLQAPIAYIQDPLGYFRTGALGNSSKVFGPYMKAAIVGYAALAVGGRRLGHYNEAQAEGCFSTIASVVRQYYGTQPDMQVFCDLLPRMAAGDAAAKAAAETDFVLSWHAFLRQHDF